MEWTRAMRQARAIRVIGLSAAALWLGSAAMLAVPRTVHAQDDSAISGDGSAATNNSDVSDDNDTDADTDADAANPNVAPANIAGSWSGTVNDKKFDAGTFSITFTQAGKIVGVTVWEVAFGVNSVGGLGNGHVKGAKLTATLDDNDTKKKCRMVLSGKVNVSDSVAQEITGKYSLKGCLKPNSSGTFDLLPAT